MKSKAKPLFRAYLRPTPRTIIYNIYKCLTLPPCYVIICLNVVNVVNVVNVAMNQTD